MAAEAEPAGTGAGEAPAPALAPPRGGRACGSRPRPLWGPTFQAVDLQPFRGSPLQVWELDGQGGFVLRGFRQEACEWPFGSLRGDLSQRRKPGFREDISDPRSPRSPSLASLPREHVECHLQTSLTNITRQARGSSPPPPTSLAPSPQISGDGPVSSSCFVCLPSQPRPDPRCLDQHPGPRPWQAAPPGAPNTRLQGAKKSLLRQIPNPKSFREP